MTTRISEIDWATWKPTDVATLAFLLDGDRLLLIRKKRGLGAGKINAPGGRLEPGETPEQAALREVEEEVGLTASALEARGELRFEFTNGYRLHVYLFVGAHFRGTLGETEEAAPFWCKLNAIPYSEMWADDALWLPHVLAGRTVDGHFLFDDDTMLDHALEVDGMPAAQLSPG